MSICFLFKTNLPAAGKIVKTRHSDIGLTPLRASPFENFDVGFIILVNSEILVQTVFRI